MNQRTLLSVKKQPTEWEKIFTNHISGKVLISDHKELLYIQLNKIQNTSSEK